MSFSIIMSRLLTIDDLVTALVDVLPPGLPIVAQPDGADVPDDMGSLWTSLGHTDDPAWPLALDVHHAADECELGTYPDLRIAEHLGDRFGIDALCGVYPSVCVVDPYDPYYALARVGGRWYLASTAGTRLMGPYLVHSADEARENELGDEPVKLIRPVVVPAR